MRLRHLEKLNRLVTHASKPTPLVLRTIGEAMGQMCVPSVRDRGFVAMFTFPGFLTIGIPGRQVYIEAQARGPARGEEFFAATKLVLKMKKERGC